MGIVEEGRLVLRSGDRGYDEARTVWNAMVDRRPQLIVRCAGVPDVVAAVRTARELGLEIGVRCGGHGVLGLAVPDGGLMIDLTLMNEVRVDPDRRRARVGGGALLGALDRATQRHGLATTAGNVSHTGVGGLTLGGGMGWLARRHGLSCDNVVSYELVTAAGEVVRASREENPELFWGLRGGGGNFGVVTEFEFRLHPVGTRAFTAEYTFPAGRALPVLRGWRDLSAEAPRQATFTAWAGGGMASVGFVWVGDPEAGRELVPALRALGRPEEERLAEPSYLELQTREDVTDRHDLRRFWKGHYLRDLPDEAIEAFLDGSRDVPGARLQAYGGAIADVPDEDSAFGHRDAAFEYVTSAGWSDPAEDGRRMSAARRAAAALEPFASGVYVNALSDEGAQGVRRAYPAAKLARLTALKDVYDPDNVFHLNHNIQPSSA
ncbi:FAD-binding oxidoreductase [Actinomadura sp. ATCC 31491]|uniref:FAD-binding oxidoreductase n=1 Tax=Actinomadura luzonensis TaxID=2805427 RepID=A0ABT0FKH3_9ACTN|nr:FAD-binding oxidoreductase [Actinomadura luzonensis]MCK2212816.1 FAD-binding oxidoreductase [Actinomadura luzonensis]